MTPVSVGDRIGPYEILGLLGEGGMGMVWKARDTRLDRIVAIKRLKGQHLTRFEQEARAIAALNHPNICVLYDVGPDFLVMEYVEGKTLRGPLPCAEAVRMGIQIANALEAAHQRGILHRDLKPANILTTPSGVKLLDFGLAKLTSVTAQDVTQTAEGVVVGTAAYMSPEQAQSKPSDQRSDIFSVGSILYELISGRRAFDGPSTLDTLNQVVYRAPAPLQSPAWSIVERCLAKDPIDRFQSATELRIALEHCSPEWVKRHPSIAVLPFANMSGDKENEYFGDGLAEEIINELTKISGLKVAARTSSFFFKGKDVELRDIGRRLNVEHVLEGSVRKAGNRLRITAQLINIGDGFHAWSERYDREMTDIFAVQDEITQAVAAALRIKLSQEIPGQRHVPNLRAYEIYLRARHLWFSGYRPQLLSHYKELLERAIELDPKFALAYSFLGMYYTMQANMGLKPAREVIPSACAAEEEALRVDPSLPEAHGILAVCIGSYDYDWERAERHWRLAMSHEPVSRDVLFWYGNHHLLPIGRTLEAINAMERGLEGDPLNLLYRHHYARGLRLAGRLDEAEAELRKILEIDGTFVSALGTLGSLCAEREKYAEAVALTERAHEMTPWSALITGQLAAMRVRTGAGDRASELIESLATSAAGSATGMAAYYALSGDHELAGEWAVRAIEQREMQLVQNLGSFLRSNPSWPAIVKLMKLPG